MFGKTDAVIKVVAILNSYIEELGQTEVGEATFCTLWLWGGIFERKQVGRVPHREISRSPLLPDKEDSQIF